MKIVLFAHHLRGNDGWSRYARDTALALKKRGHDILVLVNEISEGVGLTERQVLGGPLSYISNPILALTTARRVGPIINHFSPDIIHVIVEPYGHVIPFIRNYSFRTKFVLCAHSTYAFMPILLPSWLKRRVCTFLTRRMYAKVDAVIAISKYTKSHVETHMDSIGASGLVADKIYVMGGGVDLSKITSLVNGHRTEKAGRDKNTSKEILFVGAVKHRKGLKEAVRALSHVKTDFVFNIVGFFREEYGYIKELRALISALGLENKIKFWGVISDGLLAELYDRADLFMMLSTNNGADFEGYGLVYLEANARGVPCIGPNDSGVSDAIVDGKTGFIVDQYKPEAVAQKIEKVIIDKAINPADCITWARENSIEKQAATLSEIYIRTLEGKRSLEKP